MKVDEEQNIELNPKFPMGGKEEWEYCMIDKVLIGNALYRIQYDKTGEYYHLGKGLKIIKLENEAK